MENNYEELTRQEDYSLSLLLKSIVIGIGVALVVILYRLILTQAETFAFSMYHFFSNHLVLVPILFVLLGAVGYLVGYLVSKNKLISGSGIPQLKGILMGYLENSWLHTLCAKFVGGTLAIAGGLSLGREGPSIQLGACVAEGIAGKISHSRKERKILMVSGASAGLAATFNAPMAGVLFALEELFKYFSPMILLSTMAAAVVADFVSKQVFGLAPIFQFDIASSIPLKDYWLVILLGILLGVLGAFYNWFLLKVQTVYQKITCLTTRTKVMVPFILAGIIGLCFPVVLGGGHHMLGELTLSRPIAFLILLLVAKFLFSMISFGSGAPGGIFFPLLILGAAIGAIYGNVLVQYAGYDSSLFFNFIVLAMAGYFTAIVRAPITGVVLIMEMTGSFQHLLSLTVVALTAYVVADLLKSPPIYEALFAKLVPLQESEEKVVEHSKKILMEILIQHHSLLENKQVKEISWPSKCLLVAIKREGKEILPKGDTQIKAGDYILVLTDINSESVARSTIEKLNTTSDELTL